MKFVLMTFLALHTYLGAAQLPACFYKIEAEFFSYDVVAQAFSNNFIQQSSWQVLYNQLQQNARFVPSMVEKAAAQMNPNPLNPYQPLAASELLKRVLFQVFHDTMIANQRIVTNRIINESDINQMFIYIRSQKSPLLSACFGEQSEADQRVTE